MLLNPYASLFIHWVLSALAIVITSYIVPGFIIESFISAMVAAVVIAVANGTLRWVLLVLTLPINILTLGLFTFVVNGIVLKICAWFVPKFRIESWSAAILGALILAIVRTLLEYFIG